MKRATEAAAAKHGRHSVTCYLQCAAGCGHRIEAQDLVSLAL